MNFINLASNDSYWRGVDYHHSKRVNSWKQVGKYIYQGHVQGSNNNVYDVNIDVDHPRKSTCNCPFAEGRRVICKHMIALYLEIFPEKEKEFVDYIEKQNNEYELQMEEEKSNRKEFIIKYVMRLSKNELREKLIDRMLNELDEEYEDYYRRYYR